MSDVQAERSYVLTCGTQELRHKTDRYTWLGGKGIRIGRARGGEVRRGSESAYVNISWCVYRHVLYDLLLRSSYNRIAWEAEKKKKKKEWAKGEKKMIARGDSFVNQTFAEAGLIERGRESRREQMEGRQRRKINKGSKKENKEEWGLTYVSGP